MPIGDIRPLKTKLRAQYKDLRRKLPPFEKQRRDEAIAARVASLWQYKQCRILLCYVSTPLEVDTIGIIRRAFADGKQVAVPRCVENTRQMEFYCIQSLDELAPGTFGVLEPNPKTGFLLKDFTNGLCLVPALCYDWKGFRLGYGKGYYDRFLAEFKGHVIGLCYSDCIRRHLPHGKYDRPVDLLVTDKYLRKFAE